MTKAKEVQRFVGDMKVRKNRRQKWLLLSIAFISGLVVFCFFLARHYRERSVDSKTSVLSSPYFIPIEIKGFSSAHIPYLQLEVENNTVALNIDLGYSGWISMPSDFLNRLDQKTFVRRQSICGLGGKRHECNVYEIPKIKIGEMTFSRVEVEEANREFETEVVLLHEENNEAAPISFSGHLGWYLLSHFNVLIDCEHSILALCDSLETLKQRGYPVESFTETPLLLDRDSIDFEAMTKEGPLRCTLDTGSTWNLLNKDLEDRPNDHVIFKANNGDQHSALNPENKNLMFFDHKDICEMPIFKVGNKDFGPMTFNRIKSPLAVDAIISMEFFESTVIFIDFLHSKIYFFELPE